MNDKKKSTIWHTLILFLYERNFPTFRLFLSLFLAHFLFLIGQYSMRLKLQLIRKQTFSAKWRNVSLSKVIKRGFRVHFPYNVFNDGKSVFTKKNTKKCEQTFSCRLKNWCCILLTLFRLCFSWILISN